MTAEPAATTSTPVVVGPDHDGRAVDAAPDAAVLLRVAAGEQAALGELFDRFGRRVYSLARRICGHHSAAEDVSQDVFLTVWRSAGRYDPARGSATTWLMTLTHHKAVDAVRRDATTNRHTRTVPDDRELPTDPGADLAAVGAIVAHEVRGALADLPVAQRQVLALAYFGGHTQAETAAILGIPLGTVKSRTFAAMAVLRGRLRPLTDRP